MHYIALTGGGMLVVGCLLPWISLGTIFVQHVLDTFFGAVAFFFWTFLLQELPFTTSSRTRTE